MDQNGSRKGRSDRRMAQCGDCYIFGKGVEQSDEHAIYWYEKYLELEDDEGVSGNLYTLFRRHFTPENQAKYFKWSKKAAEKGRPVGMAQCGSCYSLGEGVEQSDVQAIYWYEKYLQLEPGDDSARDNIQFLLRRHITPENLAKSFKWAKVGAEKGYARGMAQCVHCYYFGKGVEQSDEQAMYWYEKFLELEPGDNSARTKLQILCRRSTGSS
jgi:uncharacterized protein